MSSIELHLMTLDALNVADDAAFVAALGGIFEVSPWVAAGVCGQRPFTDIDALHTAMCAFVQAASLEARVGLITAHPDLAGRAAAAGTLSAASAAEQAAAGLNQLDPEAVEMLASLNAAYRERFGFPFVLCARENRTAAILHGLRTRLNNERATEIAVALQEIGNIARLRLRDAVQR